MITLQQVRKQYGTTLALDDISLTIACGEFFVLVGQSGSGKTTLLKMLNRLIEPDSGTILVGGENIRTQSLRALRLNTGYVLQHIALFPNMTVAENIGLIPEMKGWSRENVWRRHAPCCNKSICRRRFICTAIRKNCPAASNSALAFSVPLLHNRSCY